MLADAIFFASIVEHEEEVRFSILVFVQYRDMAKDLSRIELSPFLRVRGLRKVVIAGLSAILRCPCY